MSRFRKLAEAQFGNLSTDSEFNNTRHQVGPLDGDNNVEMQDKSGVHTLDNIAVSRLNGYVRRIADRSYYSPLQPVAYLRTKLHQIGMNFPDLKLEQQTSGNQTLPLTMHGGTFGKGLQTNYGEFEKTDGISIRTENGKGLNLFFEWNQEDNGLWKISAKLVAQ